MMAITATRKLALSLVIASLGSIGLVTSPSLLAQEQAPAPAVSFVTLEARDITPTARFTGRIEAIDKVELRARVDGFLESVNFIEGAEVEAGDLLFKIEDGPYRAEVAAAQGQVRSAEGALKLAELERDRQATLVEREAVAQAVLDQAEAQLTESEGELMQQQAALESARLDLGYTEIKAPVSGRIGRSIYTIGNYVSPSSGVLAVLVSEDPIHVSFPVPVRQILALRKSDTAQSEGAGAFDVHLRLSDEARYSETGRIDFADVSVDEGTDTITIRATIANPDRLLDDGALVDVEVDIGDPRPTVLVPQSAVQFDQGGRYVLTLDDENRVAASRITIGDPVETFYAVTDGLAPGDRVITDGIQKVRPGIVVDPSEMPLPDLAGAI